MSTPDLHQALRDATGYLNFSSGQRDPRFFLNLNRIYLEAAGITPEVFEKAAVLQFPPETPERFRSLLMEGARRLEGVDRAFRDTSQAQAVLHLAFEAVLPAYRRFHEDLLQHQPEELFYQPFFMARVFETILQVGEPWEERERIVHQCLRRLNDYVGYRPVPVLEKRAGLSRTRTKSFCPIPLYLRGRG